MSDCLRFCIFLGVPYSEHSSFTELREFVQVCTRNVVILSIRICPGYVLHFF